MGAASGGRPGSLLAGVQSPPAPPLAWATLPPGLRAASSETHTSDGRVGGGHGWSGGKGRPDGSPGLLPAQMPGEPVFLVSAPQDGRSSRAPFQEPHAGGEGAAEAHLTATEPFPTPHSPQKGAPEGKSARS